VENGEVGGTRDWMALSRGDRGGSGGVGRAAGVAVGRAGNGTSTASSARTMAGPRAATFEHAESVRVIDAHGFGFSQLQPLGG